MCLVLASPSCPVLFSASLSLPDDFSSRNARIVLLPYTTRARAKHGDLVGAAASRARLDDSDSQRAVSGSLTVLPRCTGDALALAAALCTAATGEDHVCVRVALFPCPVDSKRPIDDWADVGTHSGLPRRHLTGVSGPSAATAIECAGPGRERRRGGGVEGGERAGAREGGGRRGAQGVEGAQGRVAWPQGRAQRRGEHAQLDLTWPGRAAREGARARVGRGVSRAPVAALAPRAPRS